MRQRNGSCLLASRGRHKVKGTVRLDLQDFSTIRHLSHKSNSILHSRRIQYRSRSSLSPPNNTRVALVTPSNDPHFFQMGYAGHRSVRDTPHPRSSQVLHPRLQGHPSGISRRLITNMELSTSVDIPPSVLNTEGLATPPSVPRHIPNSSTKVGESFLAARSTEPSNSTTMDNSRPPSSFDRPLDGQSSPERAGNEAGSVEMWGWGDRLRDWTPQQKKLLINSWRPSTIKTYMPAWSRWIKWAKQNNISNHKPSGSDLARFLADLYFYEKLSYNTILVHKFVVSTLCDPEHSEPLSSHPLVVRILKSIALSNPIPPKPPVWDVDVVVKFIAQANPDVISLYQISMYTAAILLLYSGRRLHDLTLLRISPANCIVHSNYIILWPAFGSKTDSANYRQSGWRLNANPNNKSLDPVHWINRLIESGQVRRESAACTNLFVTTCGQPKPASRCVISTWVKKLLKEAGVEASAGSFRAAVASKSWVENTPVEEILSRGNWRSQRTFKKFYCRQLEQPNANQNVTPTFEAIN